MYSSLDYAEDHLPSGQSLIETPGVIKVRKFMRFIDRRREEMGYGQINLITGEAGIGKTIAVSTAAEFFETRSTTQLPAIIRVKVKWNASPTAIGRDIFAILQESPTDVDQLRDGPRVAKRIEANNSLFLIVDNADRLTTDSLSFLQDIYDAIQCSVILVGLPKARLLVNRYEQFRSRVGIAIEFPPCSKTEMLEMVLPRLAIPRWKYDPEDARDIEVGERIYEIAGPSLRTARSLIENASEFALSAEEPHITLDAIEKAHRAKSSLEKPVDQAAGVDLYELTDYEVESHIRQEAKRKR